MIIHKKQVLMLPKIRTHRKDALVIFILLALVFAFFYQWPGWNENSRFSLIHAIVEEGSLSIDNFYSVPGTATWDVAVHDGHYYSDKAIGPAIIGSIVYFPLYWLQGWTNFPDQVTAHIIITFLVVGLPSAFAGSLMYILMVFVSKSRFRSYLGTLSIMLGTMAFPYSSSFFSHQFTAALLFISFFIIFFINEREPEKPKKGLFFLVGLLWGWSVISEFTSALIVIALMGYFLVVVFRLESINKFWPFFLLIAGGLIPGLFQLAYNKICFGGFLSFGYSNMAIEPFNAGMKQGLMGIGWPDLSVMFYMTFHPGKGLFWQSPVLLLAFVGAISLLRQRFHFRETLLSILIISCYIIIISGYYMWWGGRAFGVRHLIPILPYFSVLLAILPRKFNWALLPLSLLSIAQMFIVAITPIVASEDWIGQIGASPFFKYSEIYNFSLTQAVQKIFTYNQSMRFVGINTWWSVTPVIAILFCFTIIFFRSEIKQFFQRRSGVSR